MKRQTRPKRYPVNWQQITAAIKSRDGFRCRHCGLAAGQIHPVHGHHIVLTVAHVGLPKPDGTPGNKEDTMDCRPQNLITLCRLCHLKFDSAQRSANAVKTLKARRKAQ